MDYRQKFIRAETRALGKGMVEAVVSSEAKDRDGDIIRVSGWDTAEFMKYPIMLSSHNYTTLKAIIGHWEDMEVKSKKLVGIGEYHIGDNEEALCGYKLVERRLAAYSVGFKPDMSKAKELDNDDPWSFSYEFNGQELLEVSHVTIPSNREALQRAKALKPHPVIAEIIDEALKDTSLGALSSAQLTDYSLAKSVHGEHDHDEKGRHDHDEDKALLLESLKSQLSPQILEEVRAFVQRELDIFKTAQIVPTDYLAIAQRAKEQVLRGY